jgi:hypothetical protein
MSGAAGSITRVSLGIAQIDGGTGGAYRRHRHHVRRHADRTAPSRRLRGCMRRRAKVSSGEKQHPAARTLPYTQHNNHNNHKRTHQSQHAQRLHRH